ncbi:MAG: 50S ribosomal protein L35 [Lachnospiraceae bacterium]|nr:50S ribosomal protein L35 [Lachnospiraceae bacterium]
MPKLKTNRAAAKRFKKTATGKIKRTVAGKQHILTKKTQKMKRRLRKASLANSANKVAIKKMLPYM